MRRRYWALLFSVCLRTSVFAAVPSGFTETSITNSLASATAMALAPDGRIFVCEQGGSLRVIKNGALLSQPFVTLTVSSIGERGLLGVAFDPAFSTNNYLYVYYSATAPAIHNRVSRFTANGDTAVPGSEVVLLDLDNLSGASNHNGGALHFGPDGKLYIAVGENANGNNSQTLSNLLGKILRINADGAIPVDNPFYSQATDKNRAIWAMGLRNPFTFAFQNGTGRMFINDVGENTWEEINEGLRGANYGWPITEGETSDPRFVSPLFTYGHGSSNTTGCAITGGAFYNPAALRFPASYVGKYFFADFCSGWIRTYDPASDTAAAFATGAGNVVGLALSASGRLLYLNQSSLVEVDYPSTSSGELVGYWAFNEGAGSNATDSSGNGFNASVSAAEWATGRTGSALSFNGSTSQVVTPNIALANTFSISAWVNPAAAQGGYTRIAETQYDAGLYLGTDMWGTRYKFIVNTGLGSTGSCGGAFGCAEGGTVSPGWHLVTATFDGTWARLYVDGTQVAVETFSVGNTNLPLYIGHYYASNGYTWNGSIDEVRLYNRALSSAEVAALYTAGGGQPLVGYWSFDEGMGNIAADTSGSGYNAVVTDAAWTAGVVGSALSFNGSTSLVVTPNIALTNTFSISAWVNPAAAQGGYTRIAETQYDGGLYLGTDMWGTRYKFIVNTGLGATGNCGGVFGCAEGGTVSPGWHLVTATFDGTSAKLYVDGTLVGSETFSAPANTNLPLYIGRSYASNGYTWYGLIDEVRLYNKALSGSEVSSAFLRRQ